LVHDRLAGCAACHPFSDDRLAFAGWLAATSSSVNRSCTIVLVVQEAEKRRLRLAILVSLLADRSSEVGMAWRDRQSEQGRETWAPEDVQSNMSSNVWILRVQRSRTECQSSSTRGSHGVGARTSFASFWLCK